LGKYEKKGAEKLFDYSKPRPKKSQDAKTREVFFSILHSPPSTYNINRTTWKIADLRKVLADHNMPLWKDAIREIIRSEGYRWLKAKVVLTSNDPLFREKISRIKTILSALGDNDRFFSIDEFGPFSIKMKPGRRLVAPNEMPTVPQFQKSKGFLIITAALELSQNQITHFYSKKKDTDEMLKLLELLLIKYKGCKNIYLSWDGASWHISKKFQQRVDEVNRVEFRQQHKTPHVELAPLPASAQFLNVIESIFSGMAKAIIHNSDYCSPEEAMLAIDRYFNERNSYFQQNPKKAGKKIWGHELVSPEFNEGKNFRKYQWQT
jgi:hypothetical protein